MGELPPTRRHKPTTHGRATARGNGKPRPLD
nr:MAG TPA: hypothetical protein [Caudoviricetes sp.]DAU92898.1 MAG TPA: hypothetical protein [Caudoviricetes sp.]